MESSVLTQSESEGYAPAAGPLHTILVLAAIGGWTIWHRIFTNQLSAAANPSRVRFYIVTLFYEWLLFVLVVAGVRRSGASVLNTVVPKITPRKVTRISSLLTLTLSRKCHAPQRSPAPM